ncbi:MAG: hypothetical protein ACFFD4_08945 [Candidatus Odinarchaeota archaeon]
MKSEKNITTLTIVLVMILGSSVLPAKQASAVVVWQEDFESADALNDWTLSGWLNATGVMAMSDYSGYKTVDGVLTAPNSIDYTTASAAYHNSTVAYGTWKFAWYAAGDSILHGVYAFIPFIFNDSVNKLNITGKTQPEYWKDTSGYGLFLITFESISPPGAAVPGLSLCKLTNDETSPFEVVTGYEFKEDSTGWHDIIITRNLEGKLKVYYDSKLVIQITDTFTTTSGHFGFLSVRGDSRFDNITVSDTVDYTPAASIGGHLLLVIPAMSVLVLVRKKKKS